MTETQAQENQKIANAFGNLKSLMEPVLGELGVNSRNIEVINITTISDIKINEEYKTAYSYLMKLTEKTSNLKKEITQKEVELKQFKEISEKNIKTLKVEIEELKKATEEKKQKAKNEIEQLKKENETLKTTQTQQQTSLTTQTLKNETTEQTFNNTLEMEKKKFSELEKTSKKQVKELEKKEEEIKKLEKKLQETEKTYTEEKLKKENQIQKLFSTYTKLEQKAKESLTLSSTQAKTLQEYDQYINQAADTLQQLMIGGLTGVNTSLDSLTTKPLTQLQIPQSTGPLLSLIIQVNSMITFLKNNPDSGGR